MDTELSKFFKVIIQSRTYLSLFYLLLSFFLGTAYFTFLVTAISLGFGLSITLIGIPILFITLLLWRVLAILERQLVISFLGIDISTTPLKQSEGFWGKIITYLKDPFTWKSLVYLFIKFPLGIFSFVAVVTLLSIAASLIATPILYHLAKIGILQMDYCLWMNDVCLVNSYFSAITSGVVGILLLFIFLHALNGLAHISGLLTKAFLEN